MHATRKSWLPRSHFTPNAKLGSYSSTRSRHGSHLRSSTKEQSKTQSPGDAESKQRNAKAMDSVAQPLHARRHPVLPIRRSITKKTGSTTDLYDGSSPRDAKPVGAHRLTQTGDGHPGDARSKRKATKPCLFPEEVHALCLVVQRRSHSL